MIDRFDSVETSIDFSLKLFRLLRNNGVKLGTVQTIACAQAIVSLTAVQHSQLMWIYRLTLINRRDDLYRLKKLVEILLADYLNPSNEVDSHEEPPDNEQSLVVKRRVASDETLSEEGQEDLIEMEAYSTQEVDHHKDFRYMLNEDFPAVLALLEQIAKKYASVARRKTKKSKRGGTVDLRASVRDSVKFDGDILAWRYKRKVLTHTRLVMVVDVSGSMEVYSIFLLNFLYFLNQNRALKIDVFVFSTRLQPLTEYFRMKNFEAMLQAISLQFSGWSGGTKIGAALAELNDAHAAVVTRKSTVVIMSDGWDTGDSQLLDRAMAKIANRAKSVVWMNPLKGDPTYEPLAIGMVTAMPYCNEFISGHSIQSLERFSQILAA
ncbi:MAG: hypothetical protein ACI915_000367 [Gammaproteobacteria bacterium]|jgi:uncharacterized protein with von Willebrand factor type A (vWA) domain